MIPADDAGAANFPPFFLPRRRFYRRQVLDSKGKKERLGLALFARTAKKQTNTREKW